MMPTILFNFREILFINHTIDVIVVKFYFHHSILITIIFYMFIKDITGWLSNTA